MKVAHEDCANDAGDDADKLDLVVASDAICHVVADPLMEFDYQKARDNDRDADEEPSPTKFPLHKLILAYF